MEQRVVADRHDIGAVPDLEAVAQPDQLADEDAVETLFGAGLDSDDFDVLDIEITQLACHPVLEAEQVGVHQGQPGRARVHQRRVRFVLLVRAECGQPDRSALDFLACRMAVRALQVSLLLVCRGRVVDHHGTGLTRHHRDVVEDFQQVLPPGNRVVALDELGRRQLLLHVLEDRPPQLPDRAVDALALFLGVDQFGAIRHAGHEERGIQVDHVDLLMLPVEMSIRTADQQALEVQRACRCRLAAFGAPEMHLSDVGGREWHRRQAVLPCLRHPVVDHGKRKPARDAVDQLIELRQVRAFELHRGEARVGIGRWLDIEFGLVQGIVALEGQSLPARGHRDPTGGVQALREAEPEGVLLTDRVFVPAALVEGQQPLEVLDAATVVDDGQAPGRRVMGDGHLRRAGAACVLQQLRDQRELVREGEAPVAQGAALVDSDLHFHESLLVQAGGHPEG